VDLYKAQEERIGAQIEAQKSKEDEKRLELAAAGEKAQSLIRLTQNADFLSFIEDYLKPLVAGKEKEALDRSKTPEQRTAALELRDFGLEIMELPAKQREYWINRATPQKPPQA
jgi:hypothetical protein